MKKIIMLAVLLVVVFTMFEGCKKTTELKKNQAPNIPTNPSPADSSSDISLNTILSWSCNDPEGDSLTYDVYFGTNSVLNDNNLISENQTTPTYNPETLNYDTKYYWKIVTKDNHNNTSTGKVWNFTTTEANSDDDDYLYSMSIVYVGNIYDNDEYWIMFDSMQDIISSIELKINNETVLVQNFYNEWYVSGLSFNENQTYNFEVKINEDKSVSNFSLKIPDLLTANWPEEIDLSQETTVTWTQAHDTMHQEFEGNAKMSDNSESIDKNAILESNIRSYTIPANWLPAGYDSYSFSITSGNYHADSNLLATAITGDFIEYGYNEKEMKPIEKIKKIIKDFAKSLK